MKRRILALLLAICLVFQTTPVFADTAEGQQVTAGDVTVTAGNTASVTVQAENFQNIATFELYIYYDPAAFTVSSTANGSLLSGSQASVNTTEAGTVKLAAMSLNGISGSGSLLTVRFSTTTATAAGTYPITVAVGNAYGTDLQEAAIQSQSGSITVKERVESEYFSIYGERSASTLQKDDTLSYRVYNSSSRYFVTGEFTFTYDHELFAFDSATLGSGLTGEGAVWSVNSSVLGQVRIAYANDTALNAYHLFTVNLKVIADTETTTTVKATAANMYKADLSAYLSGSCSSTMSLKKLQINDYPDVWLETSRLIVGQPASSVFYLEKGAGVAAADFTVTYDPAVLRCTGVTVCDTVAGQNGMVIINENFGNGTVRFSYINMDAYGDETLSLVRIAWEPLQSPENHYQLSVSGVGVVDADQKAIPLEYLTDSGCIFVRTVVPPLCLVDGYTDHVCACGENYQTDVVEKLGHDIHQFPAQAVTCTKVGWDAYEGCSRCDYGTYAEIPALGHDEISHEGREVTCLEIGWDDYVTCSRCDYTTYQEIPALGHRVMQDRPTLVDPLEVKNDGALPFEVIDGVYYSQNHTDYSTTEFTVTALYDCSVTLDYGVSSEESCDRLIILQGSSQIVDISGSVTAQRTLALSAGEVLTLRYTKDVSVATGEDRCWVKLEYEQVLIDNPTQVPAEEIDPTCTEAVVCFDCGTQVKAALGHVELPHDGKAPTCLEPGWAEYVTCTRCDYTTYQDLAALGHDEIPHEAQVQTCLGIGWAEYVTCSRCDYTTYQELSPYGHRVYMDRPGLADPLEIRNDGALPFEVIDGVYYSQNHTDNSGTEFTVTVLYDCTVTLIYSVSSETNYDKLFLLQNGSQLDMISGTVKNKRMTLALAAGDVLTVRYSKDGSAANGEDRGWIRFEYEWVMQDIPTLVPAEEKDPTCTEAVACVDCGTVIKPALGHIEVPQVGKAATCLEIGWEPYETCTRCDYTTYQEIPALGHGEIPHEARAVTCLANGWDAYVTCSRCDYTTYVEIPALGHDLQTHEAQAATCLGIGWAEYEACTRCDHTTYVEIPVLGHAPVLHEAKAPTCTDIGWDAYETCSRCDHTTYAEKPANGHSFMDKLCIVCGVGQAATYTWDVSPNGDGAVMAYAYAQMDGTYLLEIVGSGPMKDYGGYSSPFWSLSGKIDDIYVCDGVTTVGDSVFANLSILGEVFLADSVTAISARAFYSFSGPRTVTLPAGITSIGDFAFYDARNMVVILQGDTMPESLGSIWDYNCGHYQQPQQVITTEDATYVIDSNGKAWLAKYCANEQSFVAETEIGGVPVTGIGDYAFAHKDQLITYTVPAQITSVGKDAFQDCNKLTILVDGEKMPAGLGYSSYSVPPCYLAPQAVYVQSDRVYVLANNGEMYLARYFGYDQELTLEELVDGYPLEHIGNCAFQYAQPLQTLWLPDTVRTVGDYAFMHSTLEQVELPEGLTKIGTWGFFGADIQQIVIPENVTAIYDATFSYCDSLELVYICSEAVAKAVMSSTSCGDLCKNAQTVVIPANVQNTWLPEAYIYWENALVNGRACTIYSNCSHTWEQTQITEMEPCLTDGEDLFRCSGCAVEKTEITPCHNLTWVDTVAPQCTESGYTILRCTDCNETFYDNYTDPLGHGPIPHEAKAPTCTEVGWAAYDTCYRCDYTTYQEIPATGHTYGQWAQTLAPGCETQGTERRDCGVCDHYETSAIAATGHPDYQWIVDLEATCTQNGEKHSACVLCDKVLETAVIPKLGHDEKAHPAQAPACEESGWNAYVTCSRCDYTTYTDLPALGHDYYFNAPVPPTCTQDGIETSGGCTRCDMVIYVGIPALGHDLIAHGGKLPTCTELGWNAYETCSRCDHTTYQELPAWGHDVIWHPAKAVTCLGIGWDAFDTCSRCDYTTYAEIPATGHSYGQWTETKAPTCLKKGSARRDCNACEHFETRDVAALGHDVIHHSAQAVTCTEIGWDAYDTCSRCDYTTYAEIPATGHTPSDWIVDREATYETDGSKHKECTVCDTVLEVSIIPMLAHTYVAVVTLPTCTAQGYTTHTCTDCGNSYVDDYVPATGHTYGAWVQTLAPACEAKGTERRDCTACDHYETRAVSPTGHTESDWIVEVAAACTQNGSKYRECSVCEKVLETEVLPKLGHNERVHAAKTPTCMEVGWNAYVTCSRCDYTTYTELPVLDHDYYFNEPVPPTCTQDGIETSGGCTRCDMVIHVNAPALGHDWTQKLEDVTRLRTEGANCTECNTYWYGCSRCTEVSSTAYFVGTAVGPHSFTEQVKDDAHRVPGTENPAWYYYDCAHCNTMGDSQFCDVQPGDLTGDTLVNEDDVIYLLRHVLMPGLFPANQPVDYNGDGTVNEGDAIHLLRHVLMPGLFPLG